MPPQYILKLELPAEDNMLMWRKTLKATSGKAKHVLVVDVGGTHIKVMVSGQKEKREKASGPALTSRAMVRDVKRIVKGWTYDRVSIGYPGPVLHNKPVGEPHNLAPGWVGFDFRKAFNRPVRIVNDAAMQALGDYRGGRMLFLGLGTGLGSALIVDGVMAPMELAHLPYKRGRTYEDYVGRCGLERMGKKKWRRHVLDVIGLFRTALEADEVVIGGGNARLLKECPPATRLETNAGAFRGGFRLWE